MEIGEADVEALRLGSAAVRGLHDSGPPPCHDEARLHAVELFSNQVVRR